MSDIASTGSASGTRSLADRARGAVRWETGWASDEPSPQLNYNLNTTRIPMVG